MHFRVSVACILVTNFRQKAAVKDVKTGAQDWKKHSGPFTSRWYTFNSIDVVTELKQYDHVLATTATTLAHDSCYQTKSTFSCTFLWNILFLQILFYSYYYFFTSETLYIQPHQTQSSNFIAAIWIFFLSFQFHPSTTGQPRNSGFRSSSKLQQHCNYFSHA